MYRVLPLPHGSLLATAHMPHMASVSLGFWVAVGGRYEPPPLNGISHFIEHMLFKGTRGRSAREISQAVEGVGGYLNAFTSEEHTCYYAKARHDRFTAMLDVLVDMLLHSKFARADVEKERSVIGDEFAMYQDQPEQYVQELLNETVWPDHPLGRPLTGTTRTIERIRRADLLAFHRANYTGASTVVAVAGNFSPTRLEQAVGRTMTHFRLGQRPGFVPARWRQSAPAFRFATRAGEQTQLALGIRTCSRHDRRRFALRLLNTILGENMSSRLFQVVREDLGLVYSIYSTLSFFADAGDLVISAGLETDNLRRVLQLVVRELRRLVERPPTKPEVRRAHDYVIGQIDLSLENTESQMLSVGEQALGSGRITTPTEIKRRLRQVGVREIQAAARDFFRPERLNLALVTPLKRVPFAGQLLGEL